MRNIFNITIAGGVLALLGACAQTPEVTTQPASVELAPVLAPVLDQAGAMHVSFNKLDEREETSTVVSMENGVRVAHNETTGCKWSRFADRPFAPTLTWEGCNGYTGSRQIRSTEGSIWPLQVGATQTWVSDGTSSNGDTWTQTRTCVVKGTANVTVPAGTFDTYHVNCVSGQRVRDYYYAPEVGRSVVSRSTHPKGENWYYEYVGAAPGTS